MTPADRTALVESAAPHVRRLAPAVARRLRLDGDDLTQESLLRVFKSAHHFDATKGTLRNWAITAVKWSAHAMRRTRRVPTVPLPAVAAAPDPDPAAVAEARDLTAAVWRAVGTLPPRQRNAIVARYGGPAPATQGEAGAALGVSGARVGQIERRAVAGLREMLGG